MVKCPKCQFENPDGIKFCGECGTKLEILCPHCNYSNPPRFKFCGECGQKLSINSEPPPKDLSFDEKLEKIQKYLPKGLTEKILSQRDKIEGERKQVTVMFCDMVGFTALSEKIGPEEAYSIMDQIYEILIHKVHDFEGTVNEMTGDGIMAVFGAPIALEDAPQRAIRSALAIHWEMVKFSDKVRDGSRILPVKMRIGIHTGLVVVGTLGNDLRVEFKAVGDTVNLASRMEGLAEPGTTYVTEETFKLTEGLFRFEGLGDRLIKGKEKPIKVYRVLAPSTSRTRFDVSSEFGLTPFVGRERELELLLNGLERAKTGRGQAFSIVAEAGLGKSRLLYEFRKAIANENVIFLEGKSLSYSRNAAYHPVIDILKSNFRIGESDSEVVIKEKVTKALKTVNAEEASTLPYFLDLLSVKESGIDKISISPEAKKARTIEALKQIVLKGSELRPFIMAIEDLHWIDNSSEESLKYLFEGITGARVLLIFSYRPEFIHTWGGRSYHSHVTLNRLSNRESLAMVSYLLDTEKIERNLEELMLEKTEGVPFFIEEYIRSLKDLKVIEEKDNTYYLTEESQTLAIPSRIHDVIMARVDSLPEGVKESLQIGSVIGREFSHKLLKEVIEVTEQELLISISILKDSELIYERGIYPESTYIFRHALTQESVYQSLLKSARQKYHRIIAETLEQHFLQTTEVQPELLGYHYTEADLAEKAIPYLQKAGELSVQRFANIEAIAHLNKGLELLETLPETDKRIQQELDMHLSLALALVATKGFASQEVEQVYIRSRELCQQVGETKQLFNVLCGLNMLYTIRMEYQTAQELGEQLLTLAKHQADSELLLEAHFRLGRLLFFMDEYRTALKHLEKGIALYDMEQHHTHAVHYGQDPGAGCFGFAAWVFLELGYPDQGKQKVQEALCLAQQVGHPFSLAIALNHVARLYVLRREWPVVQGRTEQLIAFAEEHRFAYWVANAKRFRGLALVNQGQEEAGIAQMHEGLETMRSLGTIATLIAQLIELAQAYEKVGRVNEGLRLLDEALTLAERTESKGYAEMYRIKGELLLMTSGVSNEKVEHCFQQALNIARRQKKKMYELRAAMSLSRLWQNQGKKEEARDLLSEIYGWFTEGFDTADLKEAKALLDELS